MRQVSSLGPSIPSVPRLDAKSNTEAREASREGSGFCYRMPLAVAGCRARARACPTMHEAGCPCHVSSRLLGACLALHLLPSICPRHVSHREKRRVGCEPGKPANGRRPIQPGRALFARISSNFVGMAPSECRVGTFWTPPDGLTSQAKSRRLREPPPGPRIPRTDHLIRPSAFSQ